MKRNVFAVLLVIMMLLTGCRGNIPSTPTEDNPTTTLSAQIKITAKGREYSIEEIQEGILKAFNTEFYYAGDYDVPMNRNLVLNKTLNYDLVFVDHEFQPFVLLIVNNLEHPWSTEEEPLYKFGIAFSEQGMEEKFYTMGTATRTELTFMTEERGETYLGSYSLHITEIVKPQHEQMSEEWKQQAEAAIRRYMDKNDFHYEKEENLEPGKYHVYIKGFSKADVDSVIVFEHENGNVYQGLYYFVHDISETRTADLNHVELVEDPGDSYYKEWLDKVRENAALHMEYWVQDSTTAEPACYLIQESGENLISIPIPRRNNMSGEEITMIQNFVQKKIQATTGEEFALTASAQNVKNKDQAYSQYYLVMESQVVYESDSHISIVFYGMLNLKGAAHPTHLLFALNYNPQTLQVISFSEKYVVDNQLYRTFADFAAKAIEEICEGVLPSGWASFSDPICSETAFINGLNEEKEFCYYLQDTGVVISYPVPFALGDHKEVLIPYNQLVESKTN